MKKIKQVLPDFPKFAITYSVTENEEGSCVNQQKMQKSLDDYNGMFGTKYELSQIQGYNGNLTKDWRERMQSLRVEMNS